MVKLIDNAISAKCNTSQRSFSKTCTAITRQFTSSRDSKKKSSSDATTEQISATETDTVIRPPPQHYYPLPQGIESIDKAYLLTKIFPPEDTKTKLQPPHELHFIKLSSLCNRYFQNPKLMQLAQITHGNNDGDGIGNACFFVCLGTRKGYNSVLELPATSKSKNRLKTLYIENSPDYEKLFVPFLEKMFQNGERDVLNKTYKRDDILSVSLFYREYTKQTKKDKFEKTLFHDYLIGVASFVIDDEPSCLLAWLGIVGQFPCKKKPKCNLKDQLDNMRGALKIGTFLICTCQWLKSLTIGHWVPVVCQVFSNPKKGPLDFYKKIFFLRLLRHHHLIHAQYLRRRDHVIEDDDQLHWYALFQPLMYLTMFEVIDQTDEESIKTIINRASFFFLKQELAPFSQDNVSQYLEQYFGPDSGNKGQCSKTKIVPDTVVIKNNISKDWIRTVIEEKQQENNLQRIVATSEVLCAIFNRTTDSPSMSTVDFPFDNNKIQKENYLFLLISKIYFGTASYYYVIRQYFYFIFRSISTLKSTHPFFEQVMPTLIHVIINRTYLMAGKYGGKKLIKINGLPDSVNEISDHKTGKILKMFQPKLLALYSESFLNEKFEGDESDIYFLKSFFNISISIINIKTNDQNPFNENYNRPWEIDLDRTSNSISSSTENIQNFIQYIKSIVPEIGSEFVTKNVWIVRLDKNDIYIPKLIIDNDELFLDLPNHLGGKLFNIKDDISPFLDLDQNENAQFKTPTAIIEKEGIKLDLIIERVEKESSDTSLEVLLKNQYEYVKHRKWNRFSKLLNITGGKLKQDDKPHHSIGPLFNIKELSEAKVDTDLVMPIYRVLDPWQEVFNSGNLAITDKLSFRDIITFRKETWLDDYAADGFIEFLNDPTSGFLPHIYILTATKFNLLVQTKESIQRFWQTLPQACTLLLIYLCIDMSHYVVVEIDVPTNNKSSTINVRIADSSSNSFDDDLVDDVRYANVDLLLCSWKPFIEIDYQAAIEVVPQDNGYDCGICSLQRIYFWKRFNHPIPVSSEYFFLKNTTTFRVFALAETLKFFRNRLSPLVFFEKSSASTTRTVFVLPANLEINTTPDKIIATTDTDSSTQNANDDNTPSLNFNQNQEFVENVLTKSLATEESSHYPDKNINEGLMKEHINKERQEATIGMERDEATIDNNVNKETESTLQKEPQENTIEDNLVAQSIEVNKESEMSFQMERQESINDKQILSQEDQQDNTKESLSEKQLKKPPKLKSTSGKAVVIVAAESNSDEDTEQEDHEDDDAQKEEDQDENKGEQQEYHEEDQEDESDEENEESTKNLSKDNDDDDEEDDDDDDDKDEEDEQDTEEDDNDDDDSDYNSDSSGTKKTSNSKATRNTKRTGKTEDDSDYNSDASGTKKKSNSKATTNTKRTDKTVQYKVINKGNSRTGIIYHQVPDKNKKTVSSSTASSNRNKSVIKKNQNAKGPLKKRVAGKRNLTIKKQKEKQKKEIARIAEKNRKRKLSEINNEIERWESWSNVEKSVLETDIFEDNPNYFIDKKLPAKTGQDIRGDIDRLKTKLYDPEQYDQKRAKKFVTEKLSTTVDAATKRYNEAKLELEKIKDKKSGAFRMQEKRVQKLLENKRFQEYNVESQAELLPFDAVYGIRSDTDKTGSKKEYFAIAKAPEGGLKEKLITRDWVNTNVEKDFLDRYAEAEQQRGWILFSQEEADTKIVKDSEDIQKLLKRDSVRPVYEYKPTIDDDRIHCIRVAVDFKPPYIRKRTSSMQWAIMTEKHSSKSSSSSSNPWQNKDENGNISRIYWNVNTLLLKQSIGDTFFDLIESAIETTYRAEYDQQGVPYLRPTFHLEENPRVEFLPNTTRYIDPYDLSKMTVTKKRQPVFTAEFCGKLEQRQYYYFDLRTIPNSHFFVNVNTRQISGICYNPKTKQWTGLEKFRERGKNKYKSVELEEEWIKKNIDELIRKAAIKKAQTDSKRFIKLPVGLGKPTITSKDIKMNPKIAYPQFGEDTCVFSSLSSALFYLDYTDVALQIDEYKETIMTEMFAESFENMMGKITNFIHDESWPYFRRVCLTTKITQCQDFNLIDEATKKPNVLYHVVLISEDGAENHAICVIDNYIFDGNYSNALKLSQENLNASCDSTFLGIAAGYKYIFK